MEQLSFESGSEFREWKNAIESVLGIGGVEELLSEDEDEAATEPAGMSPCCYVSMLLWPLCT